MTDDEATARRRALLEQLQRNGALHDDAVRAAMLAVPRHLFLPNEPLERAYADDAIATKFAGDISISSASQPAIVAVMLEQLALTAGMRVLEIGAGTGYNAALLRTLVGPSGHITTVDLDEDITAAARQHLAAAGITDVEIITADGAAGYAPNAPYDRIILTVNAADIAPAWIAQLANGGIIVLPLSIGPAQFSIAFERDERMLRSRSLRPCGFMPLRGSMGDAATGSRVVTAAPGLRLSMTNAAANEAAAIAALLRTPPDQRIIPGIKKGWFSALAFALSERTQERFYAYVSSEEARYGFVGHGYGIFAPGARGGLLIRPSEGFEEQNGLATLIYGDHQAAEWLASVIATWAARGSPDEAQYHITAMSPDIRLPLSLPPSATVAELPHWRLVIAAGDASLP